MPTGVTKMAGLLGVARWRHPKRFHSGTAPLAPEIQSCDSKDILVFRVRYLGITLRVVFLFYILQDPLG